MKFLTLKQAAIQSYQAEYKYRLALTAFVLGLDTALIAASAIATFRLWKNDAVAAAFLAGWLTFWLAIFGMILYKVFRARLRDSNWLVRLQTNGVLLKYRSYLNALLPSEDTVAVFLPFSEIEWVRKHHLARNIPGASRSDDTTRSQNYLEIKLRDGVHLSELEERLATERRTPGQKRNTWYGSTRRGISRHYPVSLSTDALIRFEWNVAPSLSRFLAAIAPFVAEKDSMRSLVDYRTAGKDTAGKEEALLELLATGDRIGAIRTVQNLYGFDTTRAVQFIEGLSPTKPKA